MTGQQLMGRFGSHIPRHATEVTSASGWQGSGWHPRCALIRRTVESPTKGVACSPHFTAAGKEQGMTRRLVLLIAAGLLSGIIAILVAELRAGDGTPRDVVPSEAPFSTSGGSSPVPAPSSNPTATATPVKSSDGSTGSCRSTPSAMPPVGPTSVTGSDDPQPPLTGFTGVPRDVTSPRPC